MSELSMAGKMAASPSEPSKRSSIHCSRRLRARRGRGGNPLRWTHSANLCKAIEPEEQIAQAEIEVPGAQRLIEFPFAVGIELVELTPTFHAWGGNG
jgi:hypothetical protein